MKQEEINIDQKWTIIAGETIDFLTMLSKKYNLTIPNTNWMIRKALETIKSEKPEELYLTEYPEINNPGIGFPLVE